MRHTGMISSTPTEQLPKSTFSFNVTDSATPAASSFAADLGVTVFEKGIAGMIVAPGNSAVPRENGGTRVSVGRDGMAALGVVGAIREHWRVRLRPDQTDQGTPHRPLVVDSSLMDPRSQSLLSPQNDESDRIQCPNVVYGGSGEIRTHERLPVAGFQDRCNRPLCHASCTLRLARLAARSAAQPCVSAARMIAWPSMCQSHQRSANAMPPCSPKSAGIETFSLFG